MFNDSICAPQERLLWANTIMSLYVWDLGCRCTVRGHYIFKSFNNCVNIDGYIGASNDSLDDNIVGL